MRMSGCELSKASARPVGRAIVDADDLEGKKLNAGETDPLDQRAGIFPFVAHRHDDRQARIWHKLARPLVLRPAHGHRASLRKTRCWLGAQRSGDESAGHK